MCFCHEPDSPGYSEAIGAHPEPMRLVGAWSMGPVAGGLAAGPGAPVSRTVLTMNWFHTLLLLVAAFIAVFVSATFNGLRWVAWAQVDLLPGLMVYAALNGGLVTVTLLAVAGGVLFDSVSANPLGASVLPLFAVGWVLQRYRRLILRTEVVAQWALGLAASAAVPVLTLVILLNSQSPPLLGWLSLWQWVVKALVGAALTPVWFWLFGRLDRALNYRPQTSTSFRPDREIKRGRQ